MPQCCGPLMLLGHFEISCSISGHHLDPLMVHLLHNSVQWTWNEPHLTLCNFDQLSWASSHWARVFLMIYKLFLKLFWMGFCLWYKSKLALNKNKLILYYAKLSDRDGKRYFWIFKDPLLRVRDWMLKWKATRCHSINIGSQF